MINLSGSDSPLRFTGAVIRRVGETFPDCYERTERVLLISNFLAALLSGEWDAPCDFGNGCGVSLMDYARKEWSPKLIKAAAAGLPGGEKALSAKLPRLASPAGSAGKIGRYFVEKYGLSADCIVGVGSGDNPQSKVLIGGDLLSLGTSFVIMASTDGTMREEEGVANAMYDGIGRPFIFGARTNGAMVWDRIRAANGLSRDDYAPANDALNRVPPGKAMTLWQPDTESFPPSPKFDLYRGQGASLGDDYAGIIDSSLGLTNLFSKTFSRESSEPLAVTGGPAAQPEILRRIAAIWNRPTVSIGRAGAALGSAVSGVAVAANAAGKPFDAEAFSAAVLPRASRTEPRPEDVAAYRGENGYLAKLKREFDRIVSSVKK